MCYYIQILNNKKEKNIMKITNTKNIQTQILEYVEPKNIYKHTIHTHSKTRYITGGSKPRLTISSVYKRRFSNYKTREVIKHITKYRQQEKEAA